MEISILQGVCVKVKTSKISILIDPVNLAERFLAGLEASVIISQGENKDFNFEKIDGQKLIIEGPGEYEMEGTQIEGKIGKKGLYYEINSDNIKILFASSLLLGSLPNEEEYDALLLKADSEINSDDLSSPNAKFYLIYGDLEKVNIKTGIRTASKINLKKNTEGQEKIILLTS